MKRALPIFLTCLLILLSGCQKKQVEKEPDYTEPGALAMKHVRELDAIGKRPVGTEASAQARTYIETTLTALGYSVEMSPFGLVERSEPDDDEVSFDAPEEVPTDIDLTNVIAVKPGRGEGTLVIGAHYDSVETVGNGTDDNASGVGVLLELAARLKDKQPICSVVFAFFDAEENGMQGSENFLLAQSEQDFMNIRAMINVDSVLAGDKLYVYGGLGPDGWMREKALALGKELKVDLITTPGTETYAAGTTGDWSDHKFFKQNGIAYAYFEATNWDIGDKDGYTQTADNGKIFHTEKDTWLFINDAYPNRAQKRLADVTDVAEALIMQIQ